MKTYLCLGSCLAFLGLALVTPVHAQDSDGDSKPGFFHRLGGAIFRGTHKLEKSDNVDPSGRPETADDPTPKAVNPAPKKSTSPKTPQATSAPKTVTPSRDDDEPVPPKNSSSNPASSGKGNPKPVAETKTEDPKGASGQPAESKDHPWGTHARKPGFVKSPYPPYNELDATGMISGSLARDPTTGKIFRVP